MQRVSTTDGLFKNINKITKTGGTLITAEWLNVIQEELVNVLNEFGVSLDSTNNSQIALILKTLSDRILVLESAGSTTPIVTANQVNALEGTYGSPSALNKYVTNADPRLLLDATGFSKNLSPADDTFQKALTTLDALSTGHSILATGSPLPQRDNLEFEGFEITDDEINNITKIKTITINSIDDIADVDTSTITPFPRQPLTWDGTNWSPGNGIYAQTVAPSGVPDGTIWIIPSEDVYVQQIPATDITLNTGNFNQYLSIADDTVQKAMETLDAMMAGSVITKQIGITIDAGTGDVTTGSKGYRAIPEAATIISWELISHQLGSISFDIKKCTYGNFPTTASIITSGGPTLSNSRINKSTNLTGWNTALVADDILEFEVSSVTGIKKVTLLITIQL